MSKYDKYFDNFLASKKTKTKTNNFIMEAHKTETEDEYFCPQCSEPMEFMSEENDYVCNDCGFFESVLPTHDGVFTSIDTEQQKTVYIKIHHFTEWLDQLQGRKGFIPSEVFNDIKEYLAKRHITDMNKLDHTFIRNLLKQLKYSKYYDHVPLIICQLQGYNSIDIDIETEERLKQMFKDLQRPFYIVRPEDRNNFLSYGYVIHKLCILIGRHDLANIFPLLKNRKILIEQEQIWKDMMDILGWEFHRSI